MPRSKLEVAEEEARQPENVAARALGHKASEDIEEFLKSLQRKFLELAKKELLILLPHIKIEMEDRGATTAIGTRFTRGDYQAEGRAIIDLLLSAMYVWNKETYTAYSQLKVAETDNFEGSPTREYLIRERIYALAQSVMEAQDE